MVSDWEEIKKLAADFQSVQLSSNLQRLSERNCIEIVSLLIEKKLIDVIFTNDGKEYLTPDQLEREILDELYVHGGRVNLVELSKILNVDLSRISDVVQRISKNDASIHVILGQMVNETYIESIAHEINEKLTRKGEISTSDLTTQFDLPSDFLQTHVMEKHLGKIIRGRQDQTNPRMFFTQAYIQRCKSKIRGALMALTSPTSISALLKEIHVPDKIFHSLWEELSPPGTVTSKQISAQYIPHIYSKMQSDWINSLFKNNGMLEYSSITKMGISDPKQFIKKQFPNENMIYLKNCAVGSKIVDLTLLSALNECNLLKSYVDLTTLLPSNMLDEDIGELFNIILATKDISNNFVYINTTVFSKQYLNELISPCHDIAHANAKSAIESGSYQHYLAEKQISTNRNLDQDLDDVKVDKRDERRKKAASGKAGGGAQGRETKTKSTKKNQRNVAVDIDDDEMPIQKKTVKNLELIKMQDIEKCIKKKLEEEGLENLKHEIAILYHAQLNKLALESAQSIFESTPQSNRRKTHAGLQERLNTILVDIRLYERGLKMLTADVQSQLIKYLLKSLGNDICNELVIYVANELNLPVKSQNLNYEQRLKLADDCGPEYKSSLTELNKSVNKTIDEFFDATEKAMKACSMIIKKVDKKKDRLLIYQHKEKLCLQLKETDDPALILHLSALILFTTITNQILHASGKFVSQILTFLQPHLNDVQNAMLMKYHDLVLKLLNVGSDSDEGKSVSEAINMSTAEIIQFVTTFEKPGVTKTE